MPIERNHEGTAWSRLRLAKQDLEAALARIRAKERALVPAFGLEELMQRERAAPPDPLPPGVEESVLERLRRSPEYPREGASAAPPPDSGSPVAADGGHVARALAGTGLVAVGIAIGALWDPLHRSSRGPDLSEPAAIVAASATPASTAEVPSALPASAAEVASAAPASMRAAQVRAAAQDLAAERAVLRRADEALAENDLAAALAAVEEHAARFRSGRLAEEREATRITALRRAGRADEARDRLGRFARAHPHSPHLAALRAESASD